MSEPAAGTFFISSYASALADAKKEFNYAKKISDSGLRMQLWQIARTRYGMNYVTIFIDGKQHKEDNETYLKLILEAISHKDKIR